VRWRASAAEASTPTDEVVVKLQTLDAVATRIKTMESLRDTDTRQTA
jgi:hypothetical protein